MALRYYLSFSQLSNPQRAIGDISCLDLRNNKIESGSRLYNVVKDARIRANAISVEERVDEGPHDGQSNLLRPFPVLARAILSWIMFCDRRTQKTIPDRKAMLVSWPPLWGFSLDCGQSIQNFLSMSLGCFQLEQPRCVPLASATCCTLSWNTGLNLTPNLLARSIVLCNAVQTVFFLLLLFFSKQWSCYLSELT